MNIFEGSRRVVKILLWMWVVVVISPLAFTGIFYELSSSGYFALVLAATWLPIFWGISYMTGFVMRGFMGVPSGQDHKLTRGIE